MGTLIGHVAPGFGFFVIGLWHLFNQARLYAEKGRVYRSFAWFPSAYVRHAELYLIMIGSATSVAMELVIGPERHTPFDVDGTIPTKHLHNFEHSSISLLFFVYAASALAFDALLPARRHNAADKKVLQLVATMAFGQQLLLFHLHSADHMGVEGQYHWLLQIVVAGSLSTTLLGIAWPRSFAIGYARSLSVLFQGAWFALMGFMLWTPQLVPKGCFINLEEGHKVVRCDGDAALHRARSLVNIEFSWSLIALAAFAVSFYLLIMWVYGSDDVAYLVVNQGDEEDLEAQRTSKMRVKRVDRGRLGAHN